MVRATTSGLILPATTTVLPRLSGKDPSAEQELERILNPHTVSRPQKDEAARPLFVGLLKEMGKGRGRPSWSRGVHPEPESIRIEFAGGL